MTITVNSLPVVSAGSDVTICAFDTTTLTASGATSYVWSTTATTAAIDVSVSATTTYDVTGTDDNGCINRDTVVVNVNDLPPVGSSIYLLSAGVTVTGQDTSICDGDQIRLNGTGATTYAWDNGVTDNVAFTPTTTTTYIVEGTDDNGCKNKDTLTITVNPLPNVGAGIDSTICFEDSLTLNGTGAVTYTWDNGVVDGQYFAPAATADYIVTGTDANSCVNTDTMTITVNSLPGVSAGSDVTICAFDTTTLTASGATSYVWSTTETTAAIDVSVSATTTYDVTGTDDNGCINRDTVVVNVNDLPPVGSSIYLLSAGVTVTGQDTSICDGDQVRLNGTGATTYAWDNGVTDNVAFTPTTTTTYIVEGTDDNGCKNTDTLTIDILPAENASFTYNSNVYCSTDADPSPVGIVTTGGKFTSSTGLFIDSVTGVIDLSASLNASTDSIIGYYPFNNNANDESGNNNNGIVNGATLVDDRFGNPNSAYLFDGIDDFIELPDLNATTDDTNDEFTISAWIKSSSTSDHDGIVNLSWRVGAYVCNNGGFGIQSNGDNSGTNNAPCHPNTLGINDGNWHHIIVTYIEGQKYIGYKDGNLAFDVTTNDTESNANSNGYIGMRFFDVSNTLGQFFDGVIDDIYIYDRSLSTTEAQALYNNSGFPHQVTYISSNSLCADTSTFDLTINDCSDFDGDGIPDYLDEDDDNDGIPDIVEGVEDTDGDGILDKFDLDSDNDGISDIVESGGADTDGDGLVDNFTDTDGDGLHDPYDPDNGGSSINPPDTDGDGLADYKDLDSDNDGLADIVEAGGTDADGDGKVDDGTDTDGDGLADTHDTDNGGTQIPTPDSDGDGYADYLDLDSDNDGITDIVEAGGTDTDGDGKVDDGTDTDGDGLADTHDTDNGGTQIPTPDSDGDGFADYLDLDSDNDGIADIVEAGGVDTDRDGKVDDGTDTDGDGLADTHDTDNGGTQIPTPDSDGDGFADYIDLDSDNDGLADIVEAGGTDTDGDGKVDDGTDTDGDGLADTHDTDNGGTQIPTPDSDGDGFADYKDLDSDNDGIADIVEAGGVDTDRDGKVDDGTDTDGDGLADTHDTDNGGTQIPTPDSDNDSYPDYLDLDADNDGIYDVVEGGDGASDTNNDGVVDVNDTGYADLDNDGMDDNTETTTEPDSDSDNIADYLELDSDGDGCSDVAEAGYTDANGDSILGPALPNFTTNGTVDTTGTNSGGYNIPADIDGNNIADYREVGPNNASSDTITACDSLVWNGTTYTTSGTYTYSTTNISGCDSVATLVLTIEPTEIAQFSYDTTNYCNISVNPTPTIGGTVGGTFTAIPTGLVIDSLTGAIDLDSSTAGTYIIQYITSNNFCADTSSTTITVEVCADNDGDGIPDYLDFDDDNDGIPDTVEVFA